MVYSSAQLFGRSDGPAQFLARRAIRIIPLYWLCTTVYVVIAAAIPSLGVHYSSEFLAKSYFFIPISRPDGSVYPVVGQGWTLNYEMMFYVLFASTLFAGRFLAVAMASILLVVIVAAGAFLAPQSQVLICWTDPIILEFVFGMALGLTYDRVKHLPRWANAALVLVALVLFYINWTFLNLPRFLGDGIPAAFLFAGATFGGFSPRGIVWRAAGVVGNASYALYLFHAFFIHAMVYLLHMSGIDIEAHRFLSVTITVGASVASAAAIFYVIERPVTRVLRWIVERRPITTAVSAGTRHARRGDPQALPKTDRSASTQAGF